MKHLFHRVFLPLLLGWGGMASAFAQVEEVDSAYLAELDSVMQAYEQQKQQAQVLGVVRNVEALRLKKEMSMGLGGALPLCRGLLLSWTDHGLVRQPALFEPKDEKLKWVDYAVGGMPLMANWVLKAAGVKSRSKAERMITANAMALGISFGASQLLKHTVNETRPDRRDEQSFPSGHATFAFVSASVLSREYGYLSPWVTVGSYGTATATQLLRMQHNKHWMNDLYMGAGIGTVGTNLAYFLTDKIFGEAGINKPEVRLKDVKRFIRFGFKPSGVSLVSGTEIGDRRANVGDATLKSGAALSAGADLTFYTSSCFALELMTRVVDAQMKVFGKDQLYTGDHLEMYHFDVGAKWTAPVSLDKRLGSRVFVGTRMMSGADFAPVHVDGTIGAVSYSIPRETKFECGAGINFYCLDTENYAWGFTCDYYHTFSHYMNDRYSISSVWKILF